MADQTYGGIQFPSDAPKPRDLMQPIEADYFNLMDAAGDPAGALLVLVDTARQPVRAELHLPEDVSDDEAAAAWRQAQHLLQDRYRGPDVLKVTISYLQSKTEEVSLPPGAPLSPVVTGGTRAVAAEPQRNWWPYIGLAAAAVALIALIWLGMRWLRGGETATETNTGDTAALETPAADVAAPDAAAGAPAPTSASLDLPPSVNADPNIVVGVRVRMNERLDQTLLTEPGAGSPVVTLPANGEALVVGGPEMRTGISDTVVWWLVQLDDGTEAWAAANSSTDTLLLPAD